MENVEDRLGRRRAPLVLPSLVLEGVTNTDVDVGEVFTWCTTSIRMSAGMVHVLVITLPLHHT
jgi:hypothetical protein